MSVLSNLDIRRERNKGHVVIEPFVPENVRGSSVDLTLGEWYYECGADAQMTIYNPFDERDVARYFSGPYKAQADGLPSLDGIPYGHPVIWLGPRARILAHTHEFAGINPPGTSEIRSRSSWGRNGISTSMCAGWGDPGWLGRWTLEIQNHNEVAVPLPVGERICQIIFHETGPVDGAYGDGSGKYQVGSDIEYIVARWSPKQMLPRAWKDERRLPTPFEGDPVSTR